MAGTETRGPRPPAQIVAGPSPRAKWTLQELRIRYTTNAAAGIDSFGAIPVHQLSILRGRRFKSLRFTLAAVR